MLHHLTEVRSGLRGGGKRWIRTAKDNAAKNRYLPEALRKALVWCASDVASLAPEDGSEDDSEEDGSEDDEEEPLLERARAALVELAPALRGSLSAAEADALAVSLVPKMLLI